MFCHVFNAYKVKRKILKLSNISSMMLQHDSTRVQIGTRVVPSGKDGAQRWMRWSITAAQNVRIMKDVYIQNRRVTFWWVGGQISTWAIRTDLSDLYLSLSQTHEKTCHWWRKDDVKKQQSWAWVVNPNLMCSICGIHKWWTSTEFCLQLLLWRGSRATDPGWKWKSVFCNTSFCN